MVEVILLLVIAMANFQLAIADATRATEKQLIENLLKDYDRRTIPRSSSNDSFHVKFDLLIEQIINVDEKNQILTGSYWLIEQWIDEELQWDPTQYGGIKSVVLPENEVWTPDIWLLNDVHQVLTKKNEAYDSLKVFSDGLMFKVYRLVLISSCSMNLKFFPFDIQNCTLSFSSQTYCDSEFKLTSSPVFHTTYYTENSGFELLENGLKVFEESISDCKGDNPDVTIVKYHVVFKRRPLFYLFNLVLPCTLISLVAALSFLIPPDSGEKLGLGITVLLSLTVFLLILSDQMPPTAELPLIGVYFFGIIMIVTISSGLSVLSLSAYHNAEYNTKPVPYWVRRLVFGRIATLFCMNSSFIKKSTSKIMGETHKDIIDLKTKTVAGKEEEDTTKASSGGNADITLIYQSIRRLENLVFEKKRREDIVTEWKQLAMVMDRILLVLFVTVNVIFTFWIIFNAASEPDQQ